MLYREHTPIETHRLGNREILVKREDMYGIPPAPPLAKLRGLRKLLRRWREDGVSLVGCFETRVSNIGHGLAAAVTEFPAIRCIVGYPQVKGKPLTDSIRQAESLGAQSYPVRNNYVAICYGQVRKFVEAQGGHMVPFGFECEEALTSVAEEAATIPRYMVEGGTVVVCCGSGVTLAGLLKGLPGEPSRIVGVSSGRSLKRIQECLSRNVARIPSSLEIHPPTISYHEAPDLDCPFPAHPNYDLKAWKHLVDNLELYKDPLLFWNVGA